MKIVVAPNAFKGSLTGKQAAESIREGIMRACPECEVVCSPVADGGDGLSEVLTEALNGQWCETLVHNPLMENILASYGYFTQDMAVIEMALASGLSLLTDEQQDPTRTTTYGTGELILSALDRGARRIIIGLGGSATCDGGMGMAAALGFRFLDSSGIELEPTGSSLPLIHSIDTEKVDPRIAETRFEGVCDVTNPLTGKDGASHVYSPQKGADEQQVEFLDQGLVNFARVIQNQFSIDVDNIPGAGAAGGLGAGLHCFLGVKLRKGIDLVMELTGLEEKLKNSDLVITGEGQIDYQTKFNKAPAGVARLAQKHNVPCIALCGSIGERVEELYDAGFTAIFSLCSGPINLQQAMAGAHHLLSAKSEQLLRLFMLNRKTAI